MMIQDQTILLVEDNDEDAELIQRAFNHSKLTNPLIRARDGIEALDYLFGRGQYAGKSDLPAVVLLDLGLPRLSGLEVLKAVRSDERTEHIPIVILTSSNHDKDRLNAYDNFANSYLVKSVHKDQFAATADQLVRNLMDSVARAAALQQKLTRQIS